MKSSSVAGLFGLAMVSLAPVSHAVSFTQGDVTLDISGVVNGYYVHRESTVDGPTGQTTTTNSGISSGLLPGWINFVATTKAGGYDLKAHISFAPGLNSNSNVIGLPIGNPGLGNPNTSPYSQIDTRNVYFQFGNASMGTVKFGRDIGMFAQTVILSDMTLLGVGGTSNASVPFNTTFGMIGHGYMYTGFQPQISYTTPKLGGFQAAAGIFQPSRFAGDETSTPGFQGMASFDLAGAVPTKLWASFVTQKTDCSGSACANEPFTATGFDAGVKAGFGNAEAVAYLFRGKGLGLSTVGAQFLGGADAAGNRTESDGYFLQGTYKFGATKVGLNFGQNTDDGGFLGAGVEQKNRSYTLGVYHSLNKFITLVGELNQERITNSGADTTTKNRTISLGGIMFF